MNLGASTMSTEDVALARMGFALAPQPTAEELAIQEGIDRTMRDVIGDRYNPVLRAPSLKVAVQSGVQTTQATELLVTPPTRWGWAKEIPVTSPPGQDVIERMVNAALPHGPDYMREKKGGE
jgi:hypothetical protein